MIRPQWTSEKFDPSLLVIADEVLAERLARVTPLILKDGRLYTFDLPDPRNTAFTWEPMNLAPVDEMAGYYEVVRTATQHGCGYHAFFKPSLAEVLAQMPNDPSINAFYLDGDSVVVLDGGAGHLCNCHWLSNIRQTREAR
jgi:hypothetical protein